MTTADPNDDSGMPTFYGEDLRPWRVRLVRPGDRYGRDDCLVHEPSKRRAGDPMVEFYDASVNLKKFGPRGQFVARYYTSTLLGGERGGVGRLLTAGLCLDAGVPEWRVDGTVMTQVIRWLASQGVTP